MNKLITGLLLGENKNQEFLQDFAKIQGFKYIKIGNIDEAHRATINNLNQAEYWARVYAEAFENVKSGQNVVLDMDYYGYDDISELVVLARDNGVLHVQGLLPKMSIDINLLTGEKTVAKILETEKINVVGLDSVFIKDLNIEIIKNISTTSVKYAEVVALKMAEQKTIDQNINTEKKQNLLYILYSFLGVVFIGLLFFGIKNYLANMQKTEPVKVVYTAQSQTPIENQNIQNTNEPIFIDSEAQEISTTTENINTTSVSEISISTNTSENEIKNVESNQQNVNSNLQKLKRLSVQFYEVPFCCEDGIFKNMYNYVGILENAFSESYYARTDRAVYVITNTKIDSEGRAVGGDIYNIENASINSFVVLNDYMKVQKFAKDEKHVYFKGVVLEGMNPFSTKLYCRETDINSCYFGDGVYAYSMSSGQPLRED